MAKKSATHNRSISRPFAMTHNDPRGWTTSSVFTRLGVVAVYMEDGERPFTRLDFVWDNRLYTRDIHGESYTERGLVTIANRFTREVVYG